jgi:hypothetical protein
MVSGRVAGRAAGNVIVEKASAEIDSAANVEAAKPALKE